MVALAGKELKSWFEHGQDRKADRTLKQQLKGLGELQERVAGKTVLDIGCAEGLISIQLIDRGAIAVHGIEMRADYVDDGNRLRGDRACMFECANANEWTPVRQYDIVLMLAVLHKLKNPAEACMKFAQAARELVVIRLPPKRAPLVLDERSNMQPFDIAEVMRHAGFILGTHGLIGPHKEWMGYYERRRAQGS